jgi:hypothetical protein
MDEFVVSRLSDRSITEAHNSETLINIKNSFPKGCPPDFVKNAHGVKFLDI